MLGALLAAAAEKLGVGEHRQAQGRIFHAGGDGPDGDGGLPRLRQPGQFLIHQSGNIPLLKEVLQNAGPALIPGQHHHPVVLLQIQAYVLRRGLGGTGIGGQLLGAEAGQRPGLDGVTAHGEGVGHVEGVVFQGLEQRFRAQQEAVGAHGDLAPALQLLDILPHLLAEIPGPLGAAAGLIQKDHGVFRDVIQTAGHRVDHRQVAVRIAHTQARAQPLCVGAEGGRHGGGVFAAALPGVFFGKSIDLPAEAFHAAGAQLRQGLRRRQDDAALHVLAAALGGDIEIAHGVNVVPPELDAHRLPLPGGEEVQNAAPAGELARTFHLLRGLIAAAQQGLFHFLRRAAAAVFDHQGSREKCFRRHGAFYQAGDGGHGDLPHPLCQPVQRCDALLLPLAGDGLGLVKDEVPHGEGIDLRPQHGAQVIGEVFRRGIIRTNDKQGQAQLLPQSRRQVGPVDGGKAGNERRKPTALQQGGEGGCFLMFQYLLDQKFHRADYSTNLCPIQSLWGWYFSPGYIIITTGRRWISCVQNASIAAAMWKALRKIAPTAARSIQTTGAMPQACPRPWRS